MELVTGKLYSHGDNSMLVGYCDADWTWSADDRKSTSDGCFFMGNNLISSFSKKQNCVFAIYNWGRIYYCMK
jgi:hypothetical protein